MPTKSSFSGAPVGVFDSGVGGLSVLRELERVLPRERFVFLADQTHVPYGGKTASELRDLTGRVTKFLLARKCKAVVVACNTATCYSIGYLRRTFAIPFIGTVPAVKPACALTRSGVIGVISTPATAKSPALRKLIAQFAGGTRVICVGCPGLEELVEGGGIGHPDARVLLKKYLTPIMAAGGDVVVLGCTHYPFLKDVVRRIGHMRTVDSGRAIARHTRTVLSGAGLLSAHVGGTEFFTTGSPSAFSRVASQLLGRRITSRKARI